MLMDSQLRRHVTHNARARSRRLIGAVLGIVLANVIATSAQAASIFLPPGGFAPLVGTKSVWEPDLAGTVIRDQLLSFEIRNAAGALLYRARLQDRVVRSAATGKLHLYQRIRDAAPALPGRVTSIRSMDFGGWNTWVEYRIDGLGNVGPANAVRSPALGTSIAFNMPAPGLGGGASSLFILRKTTADHWAATGVTIIQLVSGETVVIPGTAMPVP